ncbi:microsomal signal peptidase 25 kDa subunit-domain-containing protein [Mycena floridula]|nr:microsomal signal peptidase 25 kDa subunit-domain-containing protein [Mycena floridula]
MAKKKSSTREASPSSVGTSSSLPADDIPTGPLSIVISPESRYPVKVNNANLTELKNACDDAVKRYLGRPELFKQIHQHTDVRLALGWASVFVAAGTGFYGYKVEFEQSKPVIWLGVILYMVLTTIQTLYAYFIEGSTVFIGKRKTFSKRIVTERVTLASDTEPAKGRIPPGYGLTVTYVRSTNGGKSLLAKGKTRRVSGYNVFFDEEGNMDQEAFERWVGELVEYTMEGKSA